MHDTSFSSQTSCQSLNPLCSPRDILVPFNNSAEDNCHGIKINLLKHSTDETPNPVDTFQLTCASLFNTKEIIPRIEAFMW